MTLGTSESLDRLPTTVGGGAVRCLKSLGVDIAFGIPGVHNQAFYNALIDLDELRSVITRHEQGAAFMADGFARVSGKVAACLLITGPGLTNAATAIAEAYSDSVPMICIVTSYEASPHVYGRRLHDLKDQAAVLEGLFKRSIRVASAPELSAAVELAFLEALSGRPGPVAVEVPIELLDLEVHSATRSSEFHGLTAAGEARALGGPRFDHRLAEGVFEGAKPVVVIGGGCVGASSEVVALIERLGAVAICTASGKGVVPDDHPLALGAWLKSDVAREIVAGADPLILLGTEWSTTDLGEKPFELPSRVTRVDIDPFPHPIVGPSIESDVGDVVRAWLAELDRAAPSRPWPDVEGLRLRAKSEPRRWAGSAVEYIEVLRDTVDRDAIVVNDMNTLSYAAVERFDSYRPRHFLFPRGYGTLGYALPAAIGAKLAAPDTQVIAIAGDGGFLFTSEELITAVRLKQCLPVVIWNNESFGAIRATRTAAYGRSSGDELINPDFVAFAQAFGATGTRVSSPQAFREALREALQRQGPTVIDVMAV